jgi:hypothetical protein
MKHCVLVLFLAVLLPQSLVAYAGPASRAGAGSLVVQTFMDDFRAAMQINDAREMERLVRTRTDEAVDAIVRICEELAVRPTDRLENEIDALRKAWRATLKTDFVNIEYEYYSLLSPNFKRQHRQLQQRWEMAHKRYGEVLASGPPEQFLELGMQFLTLGEDFEGLGDFYRASQCFLLYGKCFDEDHAGENADLRRACDGYGRTVEMLEKVELTDQRHAVTKERFNFLEDSGYGDPTKGPAARKAAKDAAEAMNAMSLTTTFEVYPEIDAVLRPLYNADEIYQMWTGCYMYATGTVGQIFSLENSPRIERTGAAKIQIDSDGDGAVDKDVPMSGKIAPVEITLGQGSEAIPWAFLTTIGLQDDRFQGIRYNLGPADEFVCIYLAPAASMVAMLGEVPIRILHDNMDGIYGSLPRELGHLGTIEGYYAPEMDSVVIGEAKVARPWSEVQEIEGSWYKFESKNRGKEISLTPTELETGTLKIAYKGPSIEWLVVRGTTPTMANYFFNVAEGGKNGIQVPKGRYKLYAAQVSKGKRASKMKAMMMPSRNTPTWDVQAGGTTTIELGSPFSMDFDVEQNATSGWITGSSIVVTGKSEETYQRLWNCVLQPEVNVRPAGKKRGKDVGQMKPAGTQEEVSDIYGGDMKTLWFPVDFSFEKKKEGEDVEVQLVEKKNKLFGKIESDWKG